MHQRFGLLFRYLLAKARRRAMHKRGDMYPARVILPKTWQRGMRAALQRVYGYRLLERPAPAAVWARKEIDYR